MRVELLFISLLAAVTADDEFEIAYIPRPPEERPMTVMSLLFTGLIVVATLVFFQRVAVLKLNASLLVKAGVVPSLLLLGALGGLVALDIYFWVWGNLINTIRVLVIVAIPVLFVARLGLAAVAKARAESIAKSS